MENNFKNCTPYIFGSSLKVFKVMQDKLPLDQPVGSFFIRMLAKFTKLSHPTIIKALKDLEKLKIIERTEPLCSGFPKQCLIRPVADWIVGAVHFVVEPHEKLQKNTL